MFTFLGICTFLLIITSLFTGGYVISAFFEEKDYKRGGIALIMLCVLVVLSYFSIRQRTEYKNREVFQTVKSEHLYKIIYEIYEPTITMKDSILHNNPVRIIPYNDVYDGLFHNVVEYGYRMEDDKGKIIFKSHYPIKIIEQSKIK